MKVLLVDDSGTMRTIQKRCLNKLNVTEIHEAENGQQALQLFKSENPDVVLSDWNMPVMDGITFLVELRKLDPKVPFIMITTEAERNRVVEAIKCGISDYLVKPFTQDALRDKLEKWVGNHVVNS
jgi:two-component system chemotaxis response regulator CheY